MTEVLPSLQEFPTTLHLPAAYSNTLTATPAGTATITNVSEVLDSMVERLELVAVVKRMEIQHAKVKDSLALCLEAMKPFVSKMTPRLRVALDHFAKIDRPIKCSNEQAKSCMENYLQLKKVHLKHEKVEAFLSRMIVMHKQQLKKLHITLPVQRSCPEEITPNIEQPNTAPEAKKRKLEVTKESVLEDMKIMSTPSRNCFQELPREIVQEIFSFLSFKQLMTVSLVDRLFYHIAGNDMRWQELCTDLGICEPNAVINQTLKNAYAIYRLGQQKCMRCGLKTRSKPSPWNFVVCRSCQCSVLLSKKQIKSLYLLNESEILCLSGFATSKNADRYLYLRKDVEAAALEKWGTHEQLEKEIQKRETKREKIKSKNDKFVTEVEGMICKEMTAGE